MLDCGRGSTVAGSGSFLSGTMVVFVVIRGRS